VLANDLDPLAGGLAVAQVEGTDSGSLTVNPDNSVTYTPVQGFAGVDVFTYVARDSAGNIDTAQVTVIVSAQDQADPKPEVVTIDPEEVATLSFTTPDAAIGIELPAGTYTGTLGDKEVCFVAFAGATSIMQARMSVPSSKAFGGVAFVVDVFVDETRLAEGEYGKPVVVTLTYDPAALGSSDAASLHLRYWTGTEWSSDGLAVLENDVANHRLVARVNHLGEMGLFVNTTLPDGNLVFLPAVKR